MRDLEAIKAKIRALLNKTVENGCTEGEAIAAAAKAMQMLREHGLKQEQLDLGQASSGLGRTKRNLLDTLWGHVAFACRCRLLYVQGAQELRVEFIGRGPWPEIADWLRTTLQGAHDRAMKVFRQSPGYVRRRLPRTRASARRAFTKGFIDGVIDRIVALFNHDELLAIRDEVRSVKAATSDVAVRKLAGIGKGGASGATADDRAAGRRAGSQTQVAWGITSDGQKAIAG